MYKEYKEVVKRCKEQDIDIKNCHIYIEGCSLDGNPCLQGTISQDNNWFCIPIPYYNECACMEIYRPICFEVKNIFTTYLRRGDMWKLVTCLVLYKRKGVLK